MLFAFVLSVMPLLAVAKTAAQGKMAMESWMLKPLSPNDEHFKPPSKSVSSYVDQSTYWLSTVYFSSTYCSTDEIIMKTAFPTGTCIQSDDPTDSFSSVSVYCYSEYTCYYYTYTDSNCGMYQTSYSVNLNMCQAGDADDDGYVTDDGNQFTAKQLIAQVGFPVPLPGNSTTLTYYNSMYCDQSSMSNYILAYPDYCYNNYNGTIRTSTKYTNPNLLTYQGNGCEPGMVDATVSYPPGACQIDFSTSPATSSMLVLNFPKPPVVPVNTAAIVGATVGGFAAIALLDAMLYFFVPPQSSSDSSAAQATKSGEF